MAYPLTEPEQECMDALVRAWNKYCDLEELHPADRREFELAIHMAQNIVYSRVALRMILEDVESDEKA